MLKRLANFVLIKPRNLLVPNFFLSDLLFSIFLKKFFVLIMLPFYFVDCLGSTGVSYKKWKILCPYRETGALRNFLGFPIRTPDFCLLPSRSSWRKKFPLGTKVGSSSWVLDDFLLSMLLDFRLAVGASFFFSVEYTRRTFPLPLVSIFTSSEFVSLSLLALSEMLSLPLLLLDDMIIDTKFDR